MRAPDTPKRDLSLLTEADGTRKRVVTLREAAEFLGVRTSTIHHHMRSGALASEGSARQRRVLVTSLLAYKPAERGANLKAFTPEQRREISRQASNTRWAKTTDPAERSENAKRNAAKVPRERRSAAIKAGHAKRPESERKRIGKDRWNNFTPEQRDKALRNLDWYRNLTEDERSAVAKGWWDNLSKERQREINEARHSPEAKKKTAEKAKARTERRALAEAALRAIERGKSPAKRRGAPNDELAKLFYVAWVDAGSPAKGEAVVEIAQPFYPIEISKSKSYPIRRTRLIKTLKAKLKREEEKNIRGRQKL